MMRSLLFVPADRPDRFEKAKASGADAIILDLEDAVAPANKQLARDSVREFLTMSHSCKVLVRVNPLDSGWIEQDLEGLLDRPPDGIMVPKAEGGGSIDRLLAMAGACNVPILPIATETPGSIFELGTFARHASRLIGMTWGGEDLFAALGARSARDADGRFIPPMDFARSLTLFAAAHAGVEPIETVFPDFRDEIGLTSCVALARLDGFTGMLAIHPAQVPVINAGFSPTESEIAWARSIVSAFETNPDQGALQLEGKMIDAPHLKQAKRLLARL